MVIERAWFALCRALGRLLRSARYANVRKVNVDGERQVHKQRAWYAPLLVWLGGPLMRILDTGVRVLSRRQWQERERLIHQALRGPSIRIADGGVLVMPYLNGETLATLLENPALDAPARNRAVQLAAQSLAGLHAAGWTHGDAMADNVVVDLAAGVAHWLDFETMHEASRAPAWCRADDVRALLATCLLRTGRGDFPQPLDLILAAFPDGEVTRHLAAGFSSVLRRPLAFHLGQAALSCQCYGEIGRLLQERARHDGHPGGDEPSSTRAMTGAFASRIMSQVRALPASSAR